MIFIVSTYPQIFATVSRKLTSIGIQAAIQDNPLALTESSQTDKAIEEKIQKAQSVDELADILSDELTKSLMNQIKF